MKKKFTVILLSLLIFSAAALAAELGEKRPAPAADSGNQTNNEAYSESDMRFSIATNGTVYTRYMYRFIIPALRADNALMKNNDIQIRAAALLSPVSFSGNAEINVSPAAVARFFAIGILGTGWDIPIAMGMKMTSAGTADTDGASAGETVYTGGPCDGYVAGVKLGGQFQFDLAAVMPGDWNHVVLQTTQAFQYRAFSRAGSGDSWLFEADAGENRNGWMYIGSYVLAYRILPINTLAGVSGEVRRTLYNTADGELWGDDVFYCAFGPAAEIKIGEKSALTVMVQWQTVKNFLAGTTEKTFYQDRRINTETPQSLEFYRVSLMLDVKL